MRKQAIFLAGLALVFSSCSGSRSGLKPQGGLFSAKAEGGLLGTSARSPAEYASGTGSSTDGSLDGEVLGILLQNKEFDIPVVYNEEVLDWMQYFTGVGRKHFAIYLERMARFEPIIRPKLKSAGLPEDLIYLAMIESGFSTSAKSHAGAVGPWQFIKSTGKLFGLRVDWWIDERRDPVRSTDAAVEYLSRLYAEFGDWQLACSAYNSGEMRIRNAISRLGTRDFWTIARHRRALRRETKDYVPKMMAAAILAKNAELYGFKRFPVDHSLVEVEEVSIPKSENLRTIANVAGVSRDSLVQMNPALLRCCTPPQKESYKIRVPKESASLVVAAVDAGELGRYANFRRHVVRAGDNISKIAAKHGVPVQAVLSMNDVSSVRRLRPGTELLIPDGGSNRAIASNAKRIQKAKAKAPDNQHKVVTYVVRKGDTLYGISRRYDVRIDDVKRWNDLSRAKKLRPGNRLTLYVRNEIPENI